MPDDPILNPNLEPGDPVRELAEMIVETLFTAGGGEVADRLVLTQDGPKRDLGGWCRGAVAGRIESHLSTFLAEREGERAGQVAALRGALEKALARCHGCGGEGFQRGPDPGESFGPNQGLDYPCPQCSRLRAALATGAGEKEARVLRAVGECYDHPNCDWTGFEPLADAWDALQASREETP